MKTNIRIFDQFQQGSAEWNCIRAGLVTASGAKSILTPKFAEKTGAAVDTYIAEKLSERWLGCVPSNSFFAKAVEDGKMLEDEAIRYLPIVFPDLQISRPAFVCEETCSKYGCSPDALIGDNSGLELKCPEADTHVKYLLANAVPDEYVVQVHFSMYVTGRDSWHFMSYHRGFPHLLLKIDRNVEIQESIMTATRSFLEKLDRAYKVLTKLYGAEPSPNSLRQDLVAGKVEQPMRYQPAKPDVPS